MHLLVVGLALLPYLLYPNVEFRSDDWVLIGRGVETGIFDGLIRNFTRPFADTWIIEFYRPLFNWSFCVEGNLFGNQAHLYWIVNLIWHGGAVLAASLVLKRLAGAKCAWIAALFFAASPWSINNIAWFAGRCSVVAGFFIWLGFLLYCRFVDRGRNGAPWGAFWAMLAGMFYRETTLFLPFLIFLWDVSERRIDRRAIFSWFFCSVPFVLYMVAKRLVVGDWIGGYFRMEELRGPLPPWVTEGQLLGEVALAVLDLFVPGPGDNAPDFGFLRFAGMAGALTLIILGLRGRLLHSRAFWILFLLGAAHTLALLSVDRVVHSGTSQRWYVVSWTIAGLYALCLERSRFHPAAVLGMLVLIVHSGVRWVDVMASYTESADISRALRKTITQAPEDTVFVYNLLAYRGGAAFFSLGMGAAACPPFGDGSKRVYPIMAEQRYGALMSAQVPIAPWAARAGENVSAVWVDYDRKSAALVPPTFLAAAYREFESRPRLEIVSPRERLLRDVSDLRLEVDARGYERVDVFLMTTAAQVHLPRIRHSTYTTASFGDDGFYREDMRRILEYASFMSENSKGRCWLWLTARRGVNDLEAEAFSDFVEIYSVVPQERPADRR